ncbi:hypothetical protein LR48_Vigan967s002100 [Vigna angularis]|uniref:Uncharacterized protein n=1 Tax=Phaseolus angularis TaxID=3914 RepID=A0A0L9TJ29_PHAAN|nr:hypothetical protein LR48_Vigan967s002100 [Vigna angularis]
MLRSGGDAGDERTLEREIGEPIAAASVAATMDGEGRELPACDERRRRRDFASTGDGSGGSRLPLGWRRDRRNSGTVAGVDEAVARKRRGGRFGGGLFRGRQKESVSASRAKKRRQRRRGRQLFRWGLRSPSTLRPVEVVPPLSVRA